MSDFPSKEIVAGPGTSTPQVAPCPNVAKRARIVVTFRNDDPSAVSDVEHERRLFEIFEEWGVPQTVGIVPNMTRGNPGSGSGIDFAPLTSNPAMVNLLMKHSARTGAELALHGFTHQTNRFSTPGRRFYFEFARLPLSEQEDLLRQGSDMIEQATGVRAKTFIPPWNRLDHNTVTACENTGFNVLSTSVFVPTAEKIIPFGSNSSLPEFASHLEAARRSDRRVFIHLLFHTPLMKSREEQVLLDRVLRTVRKEPECEAMTVAAVAERYPDELRELNRAGRSIIGLYEEMDSFRARAHVYTGGAFGSRITTLQQSARALYRAGDYAACAVLDKRIDRSILFLSLVGRSLALFATGGAAWLLAGSLNSFPHAGLAAAGLLALWLFAAVVIWRVTSPDSRRELATLASLASVGWIVGSLW